VNGAAAPAAAAVGAPLRVGSYRRGGIIIIIMV